jgi:tetratricopeptide (TPR) repeat protein
MAFENYKSAFSIYEKLGDQLNTGRLYNKLGVVNSAFGKFVVAAEQINSALTIFGTVDSPPDKGDSYYFLGQINEATLQLNEAVSNYEKAVELYRTTGDQLKVAKSLNSLGIIYTNKGDIELGRKYIDESQQIYRTLHVQ